jgi:hypothetical protein
MEPQARLTFDMRLALPSNAIIAGATQSGKTTLCLKLLSNPRLFNPPPRKILFHYNQMQPAYLRAKQELAAMGCQLHLKRGIEGLTLDSLENEPEPTILLIDDFSHETSSEMTIARIATNGRHKNISLWLIWHSLYNPQPASRLICQNTRYFFLLPSLRLEAQVKCLGSQLGLGSRVVDAFRSVVNDLDSKLRYVLLDAGPLVPDLMRVRSHIHCDAFQHCYK